MKSGSRWKWIALFLITGVGERLGPPDPVAEEWKARIDRWRGMVVAVAEEERVGGTDPSETEARVSEEAVVAGLRPMPVLDQQTLQWTLISAGGEQGRAGGRETSGGLETL